ncbi:MerR family transcriptional regulator [Paenibacillus sp. DMB5]|uniref:helix-turn-helix domain-containing protein n=1 Tax=Paenibacillus sp. DMB5 TaxID=1780103 RepID=UPI000AEF582E|nr:MerR family transcriptional regulator [Paenibacillus sp. DMB5]
MQKEITISELARLMQVSVHQIRYFEEKELLLPAYTDSNQYRKYSIDQILPAVTNSAAPQAGDAGSINKRMYDGG